MRYIFFTIALFLVFPSLATAVDINDYRRDIDIYRTNYASFEVKRGAFETAHTFALEEELIDSARTMLVARADVWLSYLHILDTNITGLAQLKPTNKKTIRENLGAEIELLGDHKKRLTTITTRAALLTEAKKINALFEKYQTMSFSVNVEIAISKMLQGTQSVLELNRAIVERVNQQQLSETEKASRTRGLTVSAERVNAIESALELARTDLIGGASSASDDSFSDIAEAINPLYIALNQQLQTNIELAKGVEW